jgi:S1-C subfamily serine protease
MGQVISVLGAETVGPQTRLAVQANPEAILSEVFVLEAETDQNMTQGTCFNLTGVGLVTCDHVLGLGQDLVAFHPSQPTKKHPVEVLSRNDVIDLARIRVPDLEVGDGLPHGSADDLQMADKILVAGYPNYRLGDTGTVTPGSITGFRMVSSIRRMLVDTPIIAGASGGPVLDDEGQVIGVAVTGADRMENAGNTENHGVVPIDALDRI